MSRISDLDDAADKRHAAQAQKRRPKWYPRGITYIVAQIAILPCRQNRQEVMVETIQYWDTSLNGILTAFSPEGFQTSVL